MRARTRALSRASRRRVVATVRAMVFQTPGPSNQNRAIWVWSSVRTVLTLPPMFFTSLKSRAYVWLVNAGGRSVARGRRGARPAGGAPDRHTLVPGGPVGDAGQRSRVGLVQ